MSSLQVGRILLVPLKKYCRPILNPCIYCYPLSCFRRIKQYKKKKTIFEPNIHVTWDKQQQSGRKIKFEASCILRSVSFRENLLLTLHKVIKTIEHIKTGGWDIVLVKFFFHFYNYKLYICKICP
jgi:hypothetical protein